MQNVLTSRSLLYNLTRKHLLCTLFTGRVVYNCFFLRKLVRQRFTNVTSIACSLKKENVGYCGRLSGVRGSALLAEREGGKTVFDYPFSRVLYQR